MISIAPTESVVLAAMRAFLRAVLPSGNAVFTAQIAGGVMTVSRVDEGAIALGDSVVGDGVLPLTVVTSIGAPGLYGVTPQQDVALGVLATGVPVVKSQDNRVPEPKALDFVTMTMQRVDRLRTNVEETDDTRIVGSIAGDVLTATSVTLGVVRANATLFGPGVAAGSRVRGPISGSGGAGTYRVAPAQTLSTRVMSCGATQVEQEAMLTIQLDVHGPNSFANAQTVTTMMRSGAAADMFAAITGAVTPLYADDPKQMPFINAEQQFEDRWIVEAALQVDFVVNIPQEFADVVEVVTVDVEATYPPQ